MAIPHWKITVPTEEGELIFGVKDIIKDVTGEVKGAATGEGVGEVEAVGFVFLPLPIDRIRRLRFF